MTTVRAAATLPLILVALAAGAVGCSSGGSSGGSPSGSSAATSTTAVVAADVGGAPTSTTIVPPNITGTTMIDNTPVTAADGPVQIDVLIGTDSAPDRNELVKVGAAITLNVTSPDLADTIVIDGIGMQQPVKAGETATFNFKAKQAGTYPVSSTAGGDVLLTITVV
jgi:hypothetical protein